MYALLQAKNTIGVPVLQGICSEEGLSQALDLETHKKQMKQFDENLDWLVPPDMQITNKEDKLTMGNKIRNIYTNGELFTEHLGDAVRVSIQKMFLFLSLYF